MTASHHIVQIYEGDNKKERNDETYSYREFHQVVFNLATFFVEDLRCAAAGPIDDERRVDNGDGRA